MEEIFISTYILNKYNVDNLETKCFQYLYALSGIDVEYNKIMKLHERRVSIKPVLRNFDDGLRTIIRNNV
jgi:hypothetical protein